MDNSTTSPWSTQRENFTPKDIERILFPESYSETFGKLGAKEAYHELLRLKKREIELYLHGVSLSEYYRENKVPRGFRINNVPTLGRTNPEFCKNWCQVLERCSLELMLLVIEEVGRDLKSVKSDLSSFQTANHEILQSDKQTDWLARIQEQTDSYRAELLAFKNTKRLKVLQDYREGTVYRWQQGGTYKPRRRRQEWRSRRSPGRNTDSAQSGSEEEAGATAGPCPTSFPFLGDGTRPNRDPGRPPAGVKDTTPATTRSRGRQARETKKT
ncbi:hypothetical protein XELAEV_18015462mg [Xenopus laevis]|uniref:Uncharacterized protein n=1 Tax=Xenopus laevis TaxID=8355 RepID=A0A974HW72_XENLA|nr:hypothetical protein XELAEV_18015462mg [Xenopus laevis]